PAFDGPINNRGRLAVLYLERETLRDCDLLPVESIRHIDHIPIVEIGQLGRRPLHVIARRVPLTADAIRIDRGLVPVDMQNDIAERCGPGGGERFGDAAGSHPAFALYYMY